MQTEPVGFKGTPGYWRVAMNNKYAIVSDAENTIPNVGIAEKTTNGLCDAKLMAASKKMAIALQYVKKTIQKSEEWWIDCPDKGGFDMDIIDNALKEAGL